MKLGHDLIERNTGILAVLIVLVVSVGGLVEIVPLFFQRSTTEPVAGLKPYTRCNCPDGHLYPRRLQQLPLADDPSVSRRDRALRALFGGRRVRVRPPAPVGQQAHRAGPASGRRPLQRRMASTASGQPAPAGPGIEHAGVSVARQAVGCTTIEAKMRPAAQGGVP